MANTYIGIDFSIMSPTVCINTGNDYKYFNIYNHGKLTKKEAIGLEILQEYPKLKTVNNTNVYSSKNYIERERDNLFEAEYLTDLLMEYIVNNTIDVKTTFTAIEGFSYSSLSSRLAELSGFQYILRHKLNKKGYDFFICSPKTIKATAGGGNFNKEQAISAFLNNNIYNTDLQNFLNQHKDNLYLNKKWIKPIDDIVDSFWTKKTVEKIKNLDNI